MAQKANPRMETAARLSVIAALVLFLFGLGLFVHAGTYSRYWADDYCYSATVKQMGLIRGVVDWYHTSGNRVSTLGAVAFSEIFGPNAIRYTTLGVLGLWVAAWAFFLLQLRRWLAPKAFSTVWVVALSLVMVFFAALLAPDRLQTIYWRMGTFHYTLPVPLLLINLGLLTGAFRSKRPLIWAALVSGLLAFFAAGLSETFAALQAGVFLASIGWTVLFSRGTSRSRALWLLLAPLLGTLLMMFLMMRAPANEWRQAVMPPPENMLDIVPYSLRYAADFIFYSVRGAPIPFAVYGLVIFAISLLGTGSGSLQIPARKAGIGLGLSLVITYLLIVCSFAPSAFANLQYPAGRALMPGHAALLAGLAAAAFFTALLVHALVPTQMATWVHALAILLLLAGSLYPLRAIAVYRQDMQQLVVRAQRWDARTAEIRQAVAAGQREVRVRQVDVVQSLEDIGPDPDFWINRCAEVYFDAGSIIAEP